jgi:hypothetical protein
MLCSRGRKRKSLDLEEDQENLLLMDNGDYVCMQRRDVTHKKRLLTEAPSNIPKCEEKYAISRERKVVQKGVLKNRGQSILH